MAGKRIYELLEKSTLEGTDYVAVDGSSLGEARKVAASKLLNFTNVAGSSDEYSSSKAYKVGDLVIHDNKLYKCTTACAAAPWSTNQGYFTQTTLASFGTDLKSSLAWESITSQITVNGATANSIMASRVGRLVFVTGYANISAQANPLDLITGLPKSAYDYRPTLSIGDSALRATMTYSTKLTIAANSGGTVYVDLMYLAET